MELYVNQEYYIVKKIKKKHFTVRDLKVTSCKNITVDKSLTYSRFKLFS